MTDRSGPPTGRPETGGAVTVVTDTTTYVPRRAARAARRSRWSASTSAGTATWSARTPGATSTPSTRGCASRRRCRRPRSRRSATSHRVYEPPLAAGRDIVSIHIAGGLSGTCESAREAARSLDAGGTGAIEVVDGQTGAGGLGCMVVAAASAPRRGAAVDEVVAAMRGGPASALAIVVLPRHARVPAPRRADRRRAGAGRLGAARSSRSSRSGPRSRRSSKVRTKEPGAAADGLLPRRAPATAARPTGSSSTRSRPTTPTRLVEHGTAILGEPPLFCTEVGPVLGAHLGSGMLVGGIGVAPSDG